MITRIWKWLLRHGPTVAFVVLAIAAGVAIQASANKAAHSAASTVWHSQLKSCDRGNKFRTDINLRLAAINVERTALITFLDDAAAARAASYVSTHLASDKQAATQYAKLAHDVKSKVIFIPFPTIDCFKVYPKP